QVLGFTSTDNSGTTGIEKYYDKYLAGTNGELLYETDLVGINLEGAVAAYLPAENGMNIELTVDYGIQSICESVLKKVAETYSPVSAECIVLDPNTFEILALANYPSYDLNEVPRDDTELLNMLSRNRIVCASMSPDPPSRWSPRRRTSKNPCKGIRTPFRRAMFFRAVEPARWTARR
ncbi:MAG: hypothetical protein ACLTE4_10700, partial [Christensenellaceae bacterium]